MFSTSTHPIVDSFQDRDYRYKSVATQIPQDPGFAGPSATRIKERKIQRFKYIDNDDQGDQK